MLKSQISRLSAVTLMLAASFAWMPAALGFTSNRVAYHGDGCVRQHTSRETEKALKRREKIESAKIHARAFALAFRGRVR